MIEYLQNGPSLEVTQPQKEYGYRNGQLLVTAEPWVNAAWNKPATQTDDLNATTVAAKAVNGDTDGTLAEGSVAATNSHANSWWQVDLQSVQTMSSLTVWGRTDCCPEMTSDFYVLVSDVPFTSTDLNTTINQAGVSNYLHSGFSGPSVSSGPTSINVNRTGRYVRVQLAGTGSLALAEVQVWSAAAKVEWLVADQLGTPRMVVDKTGSLAGVSHHDYLPFGEEIFAGTGGRTTTMGYSVADGVRQQFTLKERDAETGLDYFLARYYSSMQGRFTSPDPILISDQQVQNPQSWNLYNYANNNPLAYLDPTGMERVRLGQNSDEQIDQKQKEIDQKKKEINKDKTLTKEQKKEQKNALDAQKQSLGLEKEGNHVVNAMLAKLDSIGERQGLLVSDFTLSTDSANDFVGIVAGDPGVASDGGTNAMFGLIGSNTTEIFINTQSQTYRGSVAGLGDTITYGATLAVHERSHRDSPTREQRVSEPRAYTEQLRVLQKFGPAAFKSRDYYQQNMANIGRRASL